MADKLKPCPFCGADASSEFFSNDGGGWSIFCDECHANSVTTPSKAEAIAAWNTRATPPAEPTDVMIVAWQPIETAPKDEFILLYEDGMMRCGMRENGQWEPAEIPFLVDQVGNRIVNRDLEQLRGETLELSGRIREPTHWMHLPPPPAKH